MIIALATLTGALVGLVLGLTGAGGAVIAVPLLVFVFGLPLIDAAPIALLAACAAASFGTVLAWDVKLIRYRAAMLMAATGTLTTWLGIRVAGVLSESALMLAFSSVLVAVAARMFQQARSQRGGAAQSAAPDHEHALVRLHPTTGRLVWTTKTKALFSAVGALNGMLSGMLGVGGGFLIVPVLRAMTPLTMHAAIATSLMTSALTSAVSAGMHIASTGTIDLHIAVPFVAGALAGMTLGRRLAPRIAGPALQTGFAATMLACAAVMTARALY
ncbi:MAG: sulfite exporter TauE/SafE family protein [Pseudomonadota bacterium]|nr:sulfite exporter TauE/SafE family protein [Pseudomonadota bacterium]